jgi:hypothetical protein
MRVFAIGVPMDTRRSPSPGGAVMTKWVTSSEHSVGPYALTSGMPG